MRAAISRAEVMAFVRTLGADPDQVSGVTFTPDAITVTTYRLNEQGARYVEPGPNGMLATPGWDPKPATDTTVIPIMGDDRRDTVAMRHPDLPGRVIDVRPRGVGQRAMAGWEVVAPPAPEPPREDPPPESGSKPEAPAESGASSSPPPRGRRTAKKKEDG